MFGMFWKKKPAPESPAEKLSRIVAINDAAFEVARQLEIAKLSPEVAAERQRCLGMCDDYLKAYAGFSSPTAQAGSNAARIIRNSILSDEAAEAVRRGAQ